MKHKMIVELETDNRYASEVMQQQLVDMVGARAWCIDGVMHGSVVVTRVPVEPERVDVREPGVGFHAV